ncbi:MAG: hypothetical protein K2W82_04260 [Candidatus Obscuribacterales bacterium]|nr:hypothetical protein [Candidatus Obscuribacterales bacterium]
MTKTISAAILAMTVSAFALSPCLAADSAAATPETKAPESTKPSSTKAGSSTGLPTRVASFLTGVTFGVPVAIVRKTGDEIAEGTKDLLGDTNNWFLMVPAGILTVPFGCVSGTAGGVLHGVKNAWVNSDEPFSKDSFSLGDM